MESPIKLTKELQAVKGIDRIIGNWARSAELPECRAPFRLSAEDAAYCFCWDEGGARVYLAISILDDRVRLETWAMVNLREKLPPRDKVIDRLLEMLGQGPL